MRLHATACLSSQTGSKNWHDPQEQRERTSRKEMFSPNRRAQLCAKMGKMASNTLAGHMMMDPEEQTDDELLSLNRTFSVDNMDEKIVEATYAVRGEVAQVLFEE